MSADTFRRSCLWIALVLTFLAGVLAGRASAQEVTFLAPDGCNVCTRVPNAPDLATCTAIYCRRVAPAPDARFRHVWIPIATGAQAADVISTLRTGPGAREQFALLGTDPHSARLVLTKTAMAVVSDWALDRLARRHPRLARGMVIAITGIGGSAAAWNAIQTRRHRP